MSLISKEKLPVLATTGVLLAGATPAMAATSGSHNKPNLVKEVQRDVNQLAHRAYTDKKLGRMALSLSKQGRTVTVTLQESAPTHTGSDTGGEYKIRFIADIARSGGPNLNRVHKLIISEGTTNHNNQLIDGTLLEAEVTPGNARIVEENAPFNVTTPVISEAAVHPLPSELGARAKWVPMWDGLFNRLITHAENQTPTGPQPHMIFGEPGGEQALPV
ncbi:MAG TPA: hypothetical protein VN778_05725 [Verrucomicrobiae bacterium]|nr:hypothetical protein [Verrucomicrobiae bacterium]